MAGAGACVAACGIVQDTENKWVERLSKCATQAPHVHAPDPQPQTVEQQQKKDLGAAYRNTLRHAKASRCLASTATHQQAWVRGEGVHGAAAGEEEGQNGMLEQALAWEQRVGVAYCLRLFA